MPEPIFKQMVPTPDGANVVFFTTSDGTTVVPYTPNTVAAFLNGQLLLSNTANPYTESNPAAGEITFDLAPLANDDVAAAFMDTTPAVVPGTNVLDCDHLDAEVTTVTVEGTITDTSLDCLVQDQALLAEIDVINLTGELADIILEGTISCT